MAKVNLMYCGVCGKSHNNVRLQRGWYAMNFYHKPSYDSASYLLCPECRRRILKGRGVPCFFALEKTEGMASSEQSSEQSYQVASQPGFNF